MQVVHTEGKLTLSQIPHTQLLLAMAPLLLNSQLWAWQFDAALVMMVVVMSGVKSGAWAWALR
jgi:hypothetical protein